MTIQGSGPIAVSNVSQEIGQAPTFSTTLSFLNEQIKPAQRPSPPRLSAFYGMSYFQNNTEGNCNNGNCTANCNCGNIQCNNCVITGPVDCVNCDARPWLQSGGNCACTYNCNQGNTTYNCNCNCNCDCLFSDDRLKDKVGPVVDALSKVQSLSGFYYTGNSVAHSLGLDTSRQVGVSAMAVENVLPEAIGPTIDGKYLSVNYARLVPLLIEAVKELSEKVERLENDRVS